ncbi:MAG: ABC transporter permease [Planctomycetaceae bacterium]|nr:ABC transporter permease [Planctomycetaceae bacterium]
MTAYFKSIWSTRFFLFSLIKYDLNTRYQRSILGVGWSLIQPIGMTIVLCTVFHRLFGVNIREFGPFLLAGIAFWSYFTNSVLTGCQCFFQAEPYMRQYPAPAAIYPMRAALGAMFHFLMALGIVLTLTWVMQGVSNLHALPILLPTLILLVIFGWSMATLAALANTHFPDSQHLIDLGMQALFYLTPIIYPPEILNDRGLGWLVKYNPIASILELIRAPILHGQLPSTKAVYTALILTGAAFGLASFALTRVQKQLVFKL